MRFTFIHAADLHIDSPLAGLGLKDAAVAARFSEAGRRAVKSLIQTTIDSNAAFLIIAGDIFDGSWKDVTTGLFFVSAIADLHRAGIPTIMVKGNHDAESVVTRALPYPDSVHTFDVKKAGTHRLEQHRVALHGRSFAARNVPDDFVASYPARVDGWLNIGVLHTALDGTRGHASYAPCTVDDLNRFGYDYWALGHIHAREIVSQNPWIVYPGVLQGRSVRETGAKGAERVTVEDGKIISVEQIVLDGARWAHESVDISSCADVSDVLDRVGVTLDAAHAQAGGRALAIRLSLKGITPLHDQLVARRDIILDDARALGFRLAEDCWVEAIKLATVPPVHRAVVAADAEVLDIGALLASSADEPEFRDDIAALIKEIKDKLPPDLHEEFSADEAELTVQIEMLARAHLAGSLAS